MSHLQYFNYKGFGERSQKDVWYSQAVRIDNTIQISGQGGWDRITETIPEDLEAQIAQAFDNVEHTLKDAGGKGWEEVYAVRTFTLAVDEEAIGLLAKYLKKYCPNHQPLLTGVGIASLAFGMKVEIEVKAHVVSK